MKDLSTEDVRIALEMKKDADEKMVMAYLFKHTPLQINFAVNLTCLIPTENPEVGRPERLDLKQILWHFLHFRLEVVTKRLEHELAALKKRIHILEGFEKVFDALDEIIKIIRKSDGKADAAEKIMKRFELDAEQTDAILELKIYRLARLEILVIRNELEEKRKRARQIGALLKDEDEPLEARPRRARGDPAEVRRQATTQRSHADRDRAKTRIHRRRLHRRGRQRRHRVARRLGEAAEGSEGPVDDAAARGRRGARGAAPAARARRACSSRNFGVAYTCRIIDVPASTGYGEPIQKLFKLKDGEKVVAALSLDPRVRSATSRRRRKATPPPVHAVAVTSDGYALRFSLEPLRRAEHARRAAATRGRPKAPRSSASRSVTGGEILIAATAEARGILCKADEVNYLSGPGKGVILIKLGDEDRCSASSRRPATAIC